MFGRSEFADSEGKEKTRKRKGKTIVNPHPVQACKQGCDARIADVHMKIKWYYIQLGVKISPFTFELVVPSEPLECSFPGPQQD